MSRRFFYYVAMAGLTFSLTDSLIFAPALLTTPEKNVPNDFAPAVTLWVTVEEFQYKIREVLLKLKQCFIKIWFEF